MNWEGCGRKWLWPKLRHYHDICLQGLRKLCRASVRTDRVPAQSPEYMSEASRLEPTNTRESELKWYTCALKKHDHAPYLNT
jgi:hypothetical protein